METTVGIVLSLIAVVLLVAVWKGWIGDDWLRKLAEIFAVVAGLAAIFILFLPSLRSQNCDPVQGNTPFIVITEPLQSLACSDLSTAACTFRIKGNIGGIQSFNGCRIYTFVYPVNPAGAGWYIQQPPISTTSGNWTQTAILGSEGQPAMMGDTLSIQAVVVRSDATYKGTRLSDLELSANLQDLGDITGIVALSEPVFLTVVTEVATSEADTLSEGNPVPSIAPTELTVPPPLANLIPPFYYATFGLEFPEGAWIEGETYTYSLEVQECGQDNFEGQTIGFTVSGFAGGSFFLLKDGLFDQPDRNMAEEAQASALQDSYAMIIFSKDTIEEAQRILDSCRAFLIVNNGPLVPLEPYYQGPIPSIDGMFYIDSSSFADWEISP